MGKMQPHSSQRCTVEEEEAMEDGTSTQCERKKYSLQIKLVKNWDKLIRGFLKTLLKGHLGKTGLHVLVDTALFKQLG